MFWFDNEFCFKNEYIWFFLGTLVRKRKQTIFKKRWFDITKYTWIKMSMAAGLGAWELTDTNTLTAAFSKKKESSDVTRLIF